MNSTALNAVLEANIAALREKLNNSGDLIVREFLIGSSAPAGAALFFIDGLADSHSIHQFILEPLMLQGASPMASGASLPGRLKDSLLTVGQIGEIRSLDELAESILSGKAALLLQGWDFGFEIAMAGWERRNVSEPTNQTVVRGPKESFTENLRTNTALIRRKIKDPALTLEERKIGRRTKTAVAMMFIQGIASDSVVREVRQRLDRIDTDAILESGYIEEFIQDEKITVFPTVQNSERPDSVAAALLEGHVALIVDGTPHVLVVPALFIQFMQASEDYYQRSDIGTLIRIIRYIGLFIALFGPALYIAITTFHQEMLPTQLLISLAAQREGVPFPAFIEGLMMEITYEILREAGIRMPRAVGQAVSIVGTLVIGQAAVEAGIVSPAMVIVVSITAISSFVVPQFNMSISIRILRFPLMALTASFGMFGLFIGGFALLLHLSGLRSFGVPYMSPVGPFHTGDLKDVILRAPHPSMRKRPSLLGKRNPVRQSRRRGGGRR
ncbi:spore germination protein [Cohnella sp. REN36]|uniref:spore germination protein n=1 Tax=Cohnella sp. REN36 TaxID=2887347 RepID=UPI001D159A47|nr:spore germination protein [Cohnella sp. REN36]MCC3376849.1 spore germination protein [Cohnella sp. REN36]